MKNILLNNKLAYDRFASEYSQRKTYVNDNNINVIDIFYDFLQNGNPKSILDVGVGSGLDLSIFNKKGLKTYGIDISKKMIKIAKTNSPNSTFYNGNFTDFNFTQKFSAIYAQAFIHLFPKNEVQKIFEKFYSITEPSGLIHFSTTIHNKPSEGWEEKSDYQDKVKRFRKRWTLNELNDFIEYQPCFSLVHQYTIKDPFKKKWINTIIKLK